MSSVIEVTSVHYPESDGKPMGETDEHRDEMVREIELLRRFFEGQCVYVSGNLLVYYQQGNSKRFVVPDVFVVKGLEPRRRRVYKLWVEHQAPDAIVEVTSRKMKKTDSITKPKLYRRLGVKEYFLFDPTQDYLDPPLQGYRLADGKYRRIAADAREAGQRRTGAAAAGRRRTAYALPRGHGPAAADRKGSTPGGGSGAGRGRAGAAGRGGGAAG